MIYNGIKELKITTMNIPHTRKEIEHRMNLLEVAARNNKTIVSSSIGVINGLSKVMRMED
ncbi:hypothetical protein FC831_18015 [Clostridium botulinum]|nr:hypothetical protein CIT17_11740 [Clostridium botulinum]KON12238.1 hypothetical protein ACP50_09900 [Clostridium botulinum]MBY6985316.1 hypothetical protein [Clostridium botulinum]NFF24341.1 hypothetical protein [Clostridium botulinum]NFH02129.1 hypothetical protein [Clostridium botulinum]